MGGSIDVTKSAMCSIPSMRFKILYTKPMVLIIIIMIVISIEPDSSVWTRLGKLYVASPTLLYFKFYENQKIVINFISKNAAWGDRQPIINPVLVFIRHIGLRYTYVIIIIIIDAYPPSQCMTSISWQKSGQTIFFVKFCLSRSIRSSDSADRRILHGLWPVPDCGHTDSGRWSQRRHLLGIQSQPSGHFAAVRRNTDEPHQLSGQLGRSAGPDRCRLRYWQKGKWKIVSSVTTTSRVCSQFFITSYTIRAA